MPADAPYGAKHILDIGGLQVFDLSDPRVELPSLDDDAIHVAAFFGDAQGGMQYQSADTILVRRTIGQLQTGLTAYPMVDPVLLADISLNGQIQSNDTTAIRRVIGKQMSVPNIPALPEGLDPPQTAGADPVLYIPTNLVGVPGGTVTVPVMAHVTEPDGITIGGFDVVIEYDATKFSVSSSRLGSLLAGTNSDLSGALFHPAPGMLIYTADSVVGSVHLPEGTVGELFSITFAIASDTYGLSPVNLRADYHGTRTAITDKHLDWLLLSPSPTNAADDPVDGWITIDSMGYQPGIELRQDGTLLIVGTLDDDWMHVRPSTTDSQQLEVRSNYWSGSKLFPVDQVQRIEVHAGAGHDRVTISQLVTIDAWIDGGPGDVLLWGGSGNDMILGGAGNDRIWGGAGNDTLDGGPGDDRIWGGPGDDVLIGGLGVNRLWGEGGNNQLYDDSSADLWLDARTDALLGDADGNGVLTALDVLAIVNHLNSSGQRVLTGEYHERPRLDIDGDGSILPLDVLRLITLINQLPLGAPANDPSSSGGEGEAGPWLAMPAAIEPWDADTGSADSVDEALPDRNRSTASGQPNAAVQHLFQADDHRWLTAMSESEDETAELLNVLARHRTAKSDHWLLDRVFEGLEDGETVGRWG